MAGRKRSGLDKIGEALMALGETRGDVLSAASRLSIYSHDGHVLQVVRTEDTLVASTPPEAVRRAS